MSTSPHKPVLLSAMQPTSGGLHLGNYLGALKNWVRLQDQYDCIFFAVDLHTITVRQDPAVLRQNTRRVLAEYIAAGIHPERSTLFVQSHVPEHSELGWILTCHTYMGELNRMTQYKDKSAKAGANIGAGLFAYPALMAADILLYKTELVPVGEDQKQHIELTRDVALRMNSLYGKDLFIVPKPFIAKTGARIMSLQNPTSKMSKSDPDPHATVFLHESDKEIEKKLKRAVTDSGTEIAYDTENKPGVSNLIDIQCALSGQTPEQIVAAYQGKMYGHLKIETAQKIIEEVRPVRAEAERLLADVTYLDGILKQGAEKARDRAHRTLKQVQEAIGLVRF